MSQTKKPGTSLGGVKVAAEMLNHMDTENRDRILANVARKDPHLAQNLQKEMFVFEDLQKLEAADLQSLLREIPRAKLALALRQSSDELKTVIFKNMSARAAASVREEMEILGKQRVLEVQAVQNEIIQKAKRFRDPRLKK